MPWLILVAIVIAWVHLKLPAITTWAVMTGMQRREGDVLARTLKQSIILTFLVGLLVMAQQYLFPGIVPR